MYLELELVKEALTFTTLLYSLTPCYAVIPHPRYSTAYLITLASVTSR
jgi:hypothetical protein